MNTNASTNGNGEAVAVSRDDIVRVRHATKSFGSTQVLSEFDMDVRSGEHVALIGPSGSGKTTVLRMLAGLERPERGTVEVVDQALWSVDEEGRTAPSSEAHLRRVRRSVGMVFQHFNLFPHMSALENVVLAPQHVLGMSKEEATERAHELLEMVGVAGQMKQTPSKMSGGQQQRLAIARALAMRPKVMLFDEVTSALDPELVNEVLQVMRKLALETEMTLMIVTHEIDFAAEIADRMLMFDGGRVIEEGKPREMLRSPKQERTERFLKSIVDRRGV